jgi:hypothetical protein
MVPSEHAPGYWWIGRYGVYVFVCTTYIGYRGFLTHHTSSPPLDCNIDRPCSPTTGLMACSHTDRFPPRLLKSHLSTLERGQHTLFTLDSPSQTHTHPSSSSDPFFDPTDALSAPPSPHVHGHNTRDTRATAVHDRTHVQPGSVLQWVQKIGRIHTVAEAPPETRVRDRLPLDSRTRCVRLAR